MINAVFGKTMENLPNRRDIKIITAEARRDYLVLQSNYHITKFI